MRRGAGFGRHHDATPVVIALFLAAAVLSLVLPSTALAEEHVVEL